MALIKCKDCGTEISTAAKACPKCGRNLARRSPTCGEGCVIFVILAAVVVAYFVANLP